MVTSKFWYADVLDRVHEKRSRDEDIENTLSELSLTLTNVFASILVLSFPSSRAMELNVETNLLAEEGRADAQDAQNQQSQAEHAFEGRKEGRKSKFEIQKFQRPILAATRTKKPTRRHKRIAITAQDVSFEKFSA